MIEDGVLIIRDKPHKIKVDMKKIKLKENNCDSINEIKKNSNFSIYKKSFVFLPSVYSRTVYQIREQIVLSCNPHQP